MSIYSTLVQNEDRVIAAATDLMYHELPDSSDDMTALRDWRMENGRDPYGEAEGEPEGEEWDDYLRDWCENRIYDVMWNIGHLFKGNTLRVYRTITAPRDWKPDPNRHPGIYWSWDEHASEAHWGEYGEGHVNWQLVADVTADQIDWPRTLVQNALPSYDSEKEIRLIENTPVEIISATPSA